MQTEFFYCLQIWLTVYSEDSSSATCCLSSLWAGLTFVFVGFFFLPCNHPRLRPTRRWPGQQENPRTRRVSEGELPVRQ